MAEISVNSKSLRLTSKTILTSTGATFRIVTAERSLKPSNTLIETSCYNGSITRRNSTMHQSLMNLWSFFCIKFWTPEPILNKWLWSIILLSKNLPSPYMISQPIWGDGSTISLTLCLNTTEGNAFKLAFRRNFSYAWPTSLMIIQKPSKGLCHISRIVRTK